MLGPQRGWIAFTHGGEPIVSGDSPSGLCGNLERAVELANAHAKAVFPKLTARGQWTRYRLTGGDEYREWLVTLPYYPPTFFSAHFAHRNVLLHVRCDLRTGPAGERVLVLHEVQSDWAQEARRSGAGERQEPGLPVPPWLQEWPALALKLMLLHAAHLGVDALAWTIGKMQTERYAGRGGHALRQLYDRTLPSEADRLLRTYGRACQSVDVYEPVNFFIEPLAIGYEVFDDSGQSLGTAATWEEAQNLLPDGAQERLVAMHGIRLDPGLHREILAHGFPAWGAGIRR